MFSKFSLFWTYDWMEFDNKFGCERWISGLKKKMIYMLLQHKLFLLMFFFFLLLSMIGHNQDQYFFFDCFLEDHLSLLSFWPNVQFNINAHQDTKAIRKIRCVSLNFKFLSWIGWDEVDSRTITFKYLGRLNNLSLRPFVFSWILKYNWIQSFWT